MFQDYLVSPYDDDINDVMLKMVKDNKKPIVVFGCGGAGKMITNVLTDINLSVDLYCERSEYWYAGKMFQGRAVIDINDLPLYFKDASVFVAATGASVVDLIRELKSKGKYDLYGFVDRNQLYVMDYEWVKNHAYDLGITFDMLEDEKSKVTFLSYIGARANCISREVTTSLLSLWTSKQYFNDLYPQDYFDEHILVDCGAWIGDSAESFIEFLKDAGKKIVVRAFEMEDDNYKELV